MTASRDDELPRMTGAAPPPAAGIVVAAFDFDGTLTHGGSVWPFLVAVRGRRQVVTAAVALSGQLARAAVFGGHHVDEAKEALFRRTLGGLPADEVAAMADTFGLAHYRRRGRSDVRERLEWHRVQGHRLVIVSASPDCYVNAVGRELGVDAVLATRLAVGPDGRLTGNYQGRNCRGAEKIARVRRWMKEQTSTNGSAAAVADVLWAYGNSDGDRLLLGGADIGVDVGRLGRFGALRRFRRLSDLGAAVTSSGGSGDTSGGERRERRWRHR
ncbi:MAG TPA: HAD-IB family hydrolase [Acidimicrobiales bacterium]|nr:HAD-IB family hydrolase [Acidimicrobiales bacterium]